MPSVKSMKNSQSLQDTNQKVLVELMDMLCNNESYNAKIAAAKLILDNQWCFTFDNEEDETEEEYKLTTNLPDHTKASWKLSDLESSDSES